MSLAHALRWGMFGVRRAVYSGYGLLQFGSKPGARLIVPALMVAAACLWRTRLEGLIDDDVLHAPWTTMPEPLTLEVGAGVGLAVFLCVCAVVWSCWFHLRWLASTLSGLVNSLVILAVVLFFAGLAAAFHFGISPVGWVESMLPHRVLGRLDDTVIVDDGPSLAWPAWGMPGTPWAMHGLLALAVLLLTCVYVVASRGLALVLGAFPPMTAPLRPMRALRVKETAIKPVVVRIAVPKLPRRRHA